MLMILRFFCAILLGCCCTAFGFAGSLRKTPAAARDQQQTLRARRLLFQDPDLAAHNLGVTVQGRVAILWGPAPSAEVAFRAELCLRTMVELKEVRNELIVNDFAEPARRPPLRIEAPVPKLPELLPPVLPIDAGGKAKSAAILTGNLGARSKPASVQTVPNVKTPEPDLASAVRTLLEGSPAFSPVQFSVSGGRVYLRSRQGDHSDILQEAAQLIARVPGVAGVIVLQQADQAPRD